MLEVILSLSITSLIFILLAYVLKTKFTRTGGIKVSGTLVGFMQEDFIASAGSRITPAFVYHERAEYGYNKGHNSRAIMLFYINGREHVVPTKLPTTNLRSKDIGQMFMLECFPVKVGEYSYDVYLQGDEYFKQRQRIGRIMFWIFGGIGLFLLLLLLLIVILAIKIQ